MDVVYYHFRSDALIFILSVSKFWYLKMSLKVANKISGVKSFVYF